MPMLGDYVGSLISEMTMARMQSDLETVRMAEMYASHPLLKNLPVPHFRMPTLTLDVPVAIKSMDDPKPGVSPRGGVVLPALRKSFDQLLSQHLKSAGIQATERAPEFKRALDETMARVAQPAEISVGVTDIADALVATAVGVLKQNGEANIDGLAEELKAATRQKFISMRQSPPRLQVAVTTAELRDSGPLDNMARLRLSITEEAVQWTVIESQGTSTARLTPE